MAPIREDGLTGSRSTVRFALPTTAGGSIQTETVEPARVQLDPDADPPNNAVALLGSNLASGVARRLVLRNAEWQTLTPPVTRVEIDPALNPRWETAVVADRIDFRVQPSLEFLDGGARRIIQVLPGVYAASLRTVAGDRVFAGQRVVSAAESNQVAFAIGPRIAGHGLPDPVTSRIRIDIVPVFDLSLPAIVVELMVRGNAYDRLAVFTGDPDEDKGGFVVDRSGLLLQPRFDPATRGLYPVRLITSGAEAQPFWIEI
jgi:hypothetical protein